MNEGLIQFLVIAVFVIITIMDGAARRRRKAAQGLAPLPTPDGFPEADDDLDQVDESSGGSDGMLPEDLWEEIAALARGEVPASRREQPATHGPSSTDDPNSELEEWTAPEQDVSTKTPMADLQGGYLHPDQALTHREHAQVVPPEGPIPEEPPHEFVLHPREQPSKPQKEPRRAQKLPGLLSRVRLGTTRSLRNAIIVAEVLSPPVTLRDSGWKPLF